MANVELQHPALHHLMITPDIVQDLLEGLEDSDAYKKTEPGEASLAEFLEYLSHVEEHKYRQWVDAMMSAAKTKLEPYSQEAHFEAGRYSGRDAEESMAHWIERRDDNVEFLEELSQEDLKRTALGPDGEMVTLDAVLRQWAAHDLAAIQRIAGFTMDFLYSDSE